MRIILSCLLVFVACEAFAKVDECIEADTISQKFTLAAVSGDTQKIKEFLSADLLKDTNQLKKNLERQFRGVLGKKVYHSLISNSLKNIRCYTDTDGIKKYRDRRLLLYFLEVKNGVAQVLPMSVDVHYIKDEGWKVTRFASTAF